MTSVARPRSAAGTAAPTRRTRPARSWAPALGAGALAALLGAWGLGRSPLWMDETFSLGATAQLAPTIRGTGGTMALYYVLLDGWVAVVGTSAPALRALSVVCVAACVVVTARLARHLLTPTEGLVATAVVAAMPGLARYAQEARSYALVALLTAGLWAALVAAVRADGTDGPPPGSARSPWWVALAALATLGVAAHGLFLLQLAAALGSLLALPGRARLLRAAAGAVVAPLALFAAMAVAGLDGVATWVAPLDAGQVADVGRLLLAPAALPALVLLALAGVGAVHLLRRPGDAWTRWCALVPVAWAVAPSVLLIALSAVRPSLVDRYVVASVPGVALLVAVGAVATARACGVGGGDRRRTVATVAVGVVLVGALGAGQLAVHARSGYGWDAAAATVAARAEAGDAVVFPSSPVRHPFEAAWREVPAGTPAPRPLGSSDPLGPVRRYHDRVTAEAAEADLASQDRVWVVHRTLEGGGDAPLDDLLASPLVRSTFTVADRWSSAGGVQVVLLERRRP
ncbi:glycosyltransferase family 39 protein [Iamia majanohamensis]|uniref:Glycosyltransferase family 39 protein n=1 Tax=Iamia majanohamensis TaxID=467976 RepID=A0AAE9YAW8_9ACTN|nr:glycosyltransferase family 39 protein [Iamia majanohamensis]WCO69076.1 glycosyltransferase family 39 protein [Iamia majanohamensis]